MVMLLLQLFSVVCLQILGRGVILYCVFMRGRLKSTFQSTVLGGREGILMLTILDDP